MPLLFSCGSLLFALASMACVRFTWACCTLLGISALLYAASRRKPRRDPVAREDVNEAAMCAFERLEEGRRFPIIVPGEERVH